MNHIVAPWRGINVAASHAKPALLSLNQLFIHSTKDLLDISYPVNPKIPLSTAFRMSVTIHWGCYKAEEGKKKPIGYHAAIEQLCGEAAEATGFNKVKIRY